MRSARPTHLLAVLFTAVPALLAFPGCTKTVEPPTAARLTIVQVFFDAIKAGVAMQSAQSSGLP